MTHLAERILAKTSFTGVCWEHEGRRNNGYGVIRVKDGSSKPTLRAHRLVYEYLVGPIPAGMVLDHLCRNKPCVNPDHLEVITQYENVLRGYAPSAINARKTHCIHGHELSGDNIYEYSTHRQCRQCTRNRASRPTVCPDCGRVLCHSSLPYHQRNACQGLALATVVMHA